MRPRATSLILAFVALGVIAAYYAATLGVALWRAGALTAASTAFEAAPAEPAKRLLVIGDSTAVGTGAGDSSLSVAGRLAAHAGDLHVVNRGADGARTKAVLEQLRSIPQGHLRCGAHTNRW